MTRVYSQALKSEHSGCTCPDCKVCDCELKLDGFPGYRVILDVDCIRQPDDPGKRCDRIIVADENGDTFVLPVEFKSKNLNFKMLAEQLKSSLEFFRTSLPSTAKCLPVLVSTRGPTTGERKQLRNIQIQYWGGSRRIRHVKCNKSLRWDTVKQMA